MSNSKEGKDGKIETINRNLEVIRRGDQNEYKCGLCQRDFALKASARRHISSVHFQLEKFHCTSCPSVFTRKESLNRHVSKLHSFKKPTRTFSKNTKATEKKETNILPMRKVKSQNAAIIKNNNEEDEHKEEEEQDRKYGEDENLDLKPTVQEIDETNRNIKMIYRKRNREGKIREMWRCLKCPQTLTFTAKKTGRKHFMNKHLNQRFPCPGCSHPFTTKSTLKLHICKGPVKKLEISNNLTWDQLKKEAQRHFVTIQEISIDLSELPEKYECLICQRQLNWIKSARAHVIKQHFVKRSSTPETVNTTSFQLGESNESSSSIQIKQIIPLKNLHCMKTRNSK